MEVSNSLDFQRENENPQLINAVENLQSGEQIRIDNGRKFLVGKGWPEKEIQKIIKKKWTPILKNPKSRKTK